MKQKIGNQSPNSLACRLHYFVRFCGLLIRITRSLSGDGEPHRAAMIHHEAVACLYVQTRERRAVGIVACRTDGIASAVHLGRELHLAQIAAADGHAGDSQII